MEKAQAAQKRHADNRRRDAEFQEGQYVLLSTRNLRLPAYSSHKFKPRYIGPFKVERTRGVTVTLALPPELRIHPTFHASLVKAYRGPGDAACQLRMPVVEPEEDVEYEVERILRHRVVKGKKEFLVRWKYFDAGSDSWEPASNLQNARAVLNDYL